MAIPAAFPLNPGALNQVPQMPMQLPQAQTSWKWLLASYMWSFLTGFTLPESGSRPDKASADSAGQTTREMAQQLWHWHTSASYLYRTGNETGGTTQTILIVFTTAMVVAVVLLSVFLKVFLSLYKQERQKRDNNYTTPRAEEDRTMVDRLMEEMAMHTREQRMQYQQGRIQDHHTPQRRAEIPTHVTEKADGKNRQMARREVYERRAKVVSSRGQ